MTHWREQLAEIASLGEGWDGLSHFEPEPVLPTLTVRSDNVETIASKLGLTVEILNEYADARLLPFEVVEGKRRFNALEVSEVIKDMDKPSVHLDALEVDRLVFGAPAIMSEQARMAQSISATRIVALTPATNPVAVELVTEMMEILSSEGFDIPFICPGPEGGICLNWFKPAGTTVCEVLGENGVLYSVRLRMKDPVERFALETGSMDEALGSIRIFVSRSSN